MSGMRILAMRGGMDPGLGIRCYFAVNSLRPSQSLVFMPLCLTAKIFPVFFTDKFAVVVRISELTANLKKIKTRRNPEIRARVLSRPC